MKVKCTYQDNEFTNFTSFIKNSFVCMKLLFFSFEKKNSQVAMFIDLFFFFFYLHF